MLWGRGMNMQLGTTGDWWAQPSQKQVAAARKRRQKLAPELAKKLSAAADALREYARICNECDDGSGTSKAAAGRDSRLVLAASLDEYAGYLEDLIERGVLSPDRGQP